MRLAFAGTPATALPSLQALLQSTRHKVVAVITRPAAAAGRGHVASTSPVEDLAREAGVELLTPSRPGEPAFLAQLAELAPDCCPVVAYGALLPASALAIPVHGWVNLHFSLLPAWRGAAPVQHTILHGDEIAGASTFQIEAGLDTGPVYGVVTEPVRPTDTTGELLARLALSGASLLMATLEGIEDGSLVAQPQSREGVSVAGKVTVEDARVDWMVPATRIDRLVRACTPEPGAWTLFRGERLKLAPIRLGPESSLTAGELVVQRGAVRVGSASGDIELGLVQAQGKKMMPATDWARGARILPGEQLG